MRTLFFNIPAQGHINPSLPVIKELVARGDEVFYYNTEEYRDSISATGATFVPYPSLPIIDKMLNKLLNGNLGDNAIGLQSIALEIMPFILQQIETLKPHYLIFDSLAVWGNIAARVTKIPAIGFSTTFAISYEALPEATFREKMSTMLNFTRVLPQYFKIRQQISRAYPTIKPIDLVESFSNYGQMNLVFTARSFQPFQDKFDDTFKFVGASIEERPLNKDFPFEQLTGKPLVYISLGTINNRHTEFYKMCFEAFGQHTGQFILSVGKATDINTLGKIPNNFIVKNFVPQLDILQRIDAFITHGGMNSVHEGLYYGVPMIVIPQQAEQSGVGTQVQKVGAGLLLRLPSIPDLRDNLQKVLTNPQYAQHSKQLGDALKAAGGAQKAVDEIMAFTRQK
jgi:MGT family glycosyltransferase